MPGQALRRHDEEIRQDFYKSITTRTKQAVTSWQLTAKPPESEFSANCLFFVIGLSSHCHTGALGWVKIAKARMMNPVYPLRPLQYRSIWLSDIHLGYRGCKAEYLNDFLNSVQCRNLFLIGDIFDLWYMRRKGLYWPQSHNDVIRKILGKAKHGTNVVYIPGNHDEDFRELDGMDFGNISIRNRYIHKTANNKRLLIMHGDEFDNAIRCSKLVGYIGERAYDVLMCTNRWLNAFRRRLGFPYWSISTYLKSRVKNAVNAINNFEQAVAHEAKRAGVDGIVCGHIHHAEIRHIGDVLYCNDGDWVENCTAMVEHHDGTLEILHWSDVVKPIKQHPIRDRIEKQIA